MAETRRSHPPLCLSRLSIVGLLGPDTPIPVVEEIALAHDIPVESIKLENNEYFLQMVQKIHTTPIQNVLEPFKYRDYVLISKFINPYMNPRVWPELRPNNLPIYSCSNDNLGTLRSSLSRYFGFRLWTGFESLDVNFQLGLISPTSPNNIDVCILFRYCTLRGLTTNRSTTIREMEALVRMDLQGDLFFLQQQIISTISSQNLSRRSLINALHSLVGSSIPNISGEYMPQSKSNLGKIERPYNPKRFLENHQRQKIIYSRNANQKGNFSTGRDNTRYRHTNQIIRKRPSNNANYLPLEILMRPDNLILASSDNIDTSKHSAQLAKTIQDLSTIIPKNKYRSVERRQPRAKYQTDKNYRPNVRSGRNVKSGRNTTRRRTVINSYPSSSNFSEFGSTPSRRDGRSSNKARPERNMTKYITRNFPPNTKLDQYSIDSSSKRIRQKIPKRSELIISKSLDSRVRYKNSPYAPILNPPSHQYNPLTNFKNTHSVNVVKKRPIKYQQNPIQAPVQIEKKIQGSVSICPPSLNRIKNIGHINDSSFSQSKKMVINTSEVENPKERDRGDVPIVPLFNFDKISVSNIGNPREDKLIKIHEIVNAIIDKRIIPGTESEINLFVRRKLKRLQPNSQINAIILAAVLYQIDISFCFNPLLELKAISEYGGNIEKYQPIDINLKKRMNSDRVKIDGPVMSLVFNPVLPRSLYHPQSLNSMALSYGYSEDDILVDDPYYLLQMSVLTDHFYQGKSKNTLNQSTPIELDQVDDLRLWEYISYGHSEKGYSIIKYSELDAMFRRYGYFRYLKNNKSDPDVYPRQAIKRLILLLLRPSYQDEPGDSINLRHNLALKIHQIIQADDTLMPAERNLRNKYRESNENRRIIKQLMDKFLDITMKMRGWTVVDRYKRPVPYPIINTPVDNPFQIEVRVTDAIGVFDRFCGEHGECSEVFLKYPLFKYRGGYVRSNDIDDGFTIQDRINIVRFDETITACIRLTSNWFGATHSKISKVLGIDQAFDIKQLRSIG